eukprot:2141341-Rhodomonas_salina.1
MFHTSLRAVFVVQTPAHSITAFRNSVSNNTVTGHGVRWPHVSVSLLHLKRLLSEVPRSRVTLSLVTEPQGLARYLPGHPGVLLRIMMANAVPTRPARRTASA